MTSLVEPRTLLDRLTARVNGESSSYQPYLLEKFVSVKGTNKLLVTVIWEDWDHLPREARSQLIAQAYDQTTRFPADKLTIPLGLTPVEAEGSGRLAFSVIPVIKRTDPVKLADVRRAMRELPIGFIFENSGGTTVRFPRQEEAAEAYRMLSERFGGKPYWALTQEVG